MDLIYRSVYIGLEGLYIDVAPRNLTRYMNLSKFLGFRAVFTEEEAKKRAEPEDQDYYGFGSRSARWCINLLVGAVD